MNDIITHSFSTSLYHQDLEPSKELEEFCKNYSLKNISEVKPEIFEIYLKIVIDIYEGFVTLKPHPKA